MARTGRMISSATHCAEGRPMQDRTQCRAPASMSSASSSRAAASEEHAWESPQNSARGPPVWGVGNELDPGDGRKLAVAMQPRDCLPVGLLECPYALLLVLEGLPPFWGKAPSGTAERTS